MHRKRGSGIYTTGTLKQRTGLTSRREMSDYNDNIIYIITYFKLKYNKFDSVMLAKYSLPRNIRFTRYKQQGTKYSRILN